MSRGSRLTGLDTSFLHLERGPAHMHVAGCAIFEGDAPEYQEMLRVIGERLHLVPRYRQKLAMVPFEQGRPVWVDDPHFKLSFHVRHTALPAPGGEEQLRQLAGRIFSQALDRSRPLWEIWLVEDLAGGRFALLTKTHHALVDGVSGVDIATILFDTSPEPMPVAPADSEWVPRPLPTGAQLLADALVERATAPREIARGIRAAFRGPRQIADRLGRAAAGVGAMAMSGMSPAPPSPFNVKIGPHRRFTWVRADLGEFKAVKNALGGTVNDVVLAAVGGALGDYMRAHGHETEGLSLKAMVPVSVRADVERGALGNRVAAMWAPLPVGEMAPEERLAEISVVMQDLKGSGQAVGAEVLTQLTGFAPPTIVAQAARLQARQRMFNLVVTNVPGPQFPLYMAGRRLLELFPMVPLAANQALGIAIMSYNGQLNFGLVGDFDAMEDLDELAAMLDSSIGALAAAAGVKRQRKPRRARPAPLDAAKPGAEGGTAPVPTAGSAAAT